MDRRRFIVLGTAGAVSVITGCGGSGGGGGAATPSTGTTPPPANPPVSNPPPATPVSPLTVGQPLTDLVRLANTSSTPSEFAATLVAQRASKAMLPGTSTEFWTYNSMVPGPLIDVFEGDTVRIRLENQLSQETTVHWHGLPVPPAQDGNPMDPIAPGASRTYEFTLPVGSAGTYWYHPHPHELTAEQVYRGMAGLLIVRSRTDPVPTAIEEKLLVISDLRLAADGTIPANTAMDWQNGREGNYVLVNGQRQPVLTINPGQSQRWRILNATNARYLRLALTGHTMTLIGTDGGLLRSPIPGLDEILLAPAERVDVIVTASLSSQASAVLRSLPYDRGGMGMMGSSSTTIPLLTLTYTSAATAAVALPSALNTIADLGVPMTTKRLVFSSGMGMGGMGGGMMSFLIDGKSFDPARIDLTSRVNEVEQWTIDNRSSMDHPFHLHGTQFQVVSRTRSGVTATEPYFAWRDTVNVAAFETVVLKVVQHQLGKRMYHCHILEHESQGMMGVLEVVA
ncbi:MAG: multicopper oxidase family protein [Methanothrix sp.]|nr:multicopper oxidase family protein [Methanothrix sp.]